MPVKRFFEALHVRPQLPAWAYALLPLTWPYALAVMLRNGAYRLGVLQTSKVTVPVISIGNLTTGGTGKTPIVIAMAEWLVARGYRVVVLSRGYGARRHVVYQQPASADEGDEAFLIQQRVPQAVVIVGKNRLRNAQQAIQDFQPDVILLDDGFQYRALARDLDIILVDAQTGFGNKQLLPVGPLREPVSALTRASQVWLTRGLRPLSKNMPGKNMSESLSSEDSPGILPKAFSANIIFNTQLRHAQTGQPLTHLDALFTQPVYLLSGLARPKQFQAGVEQWGLCVKEHWIFPDHHVYTDADLAPVKQALKTGGCLITTEKDWVKLCGFFKLETSVYLLCLCPQLPPEAVQALEAVLNS